MLQISLAAARVNAQMTQKEVALALNKSVSAVKSWESGRSIPDAIVFQALCKLYKIPEDCIFLKRL